MEIYWLYYLFVFEQKSFVIVEVVLTEMLSGLCVYVFGGDGDGGDSSGNGCCWFLSKEWECIVSLSTVMPIRIDWAVIYWVLKFSSLFIWFLVILIVVGGDGGGGVWWWCFCFKTIMYVSLDVHWAVSRSSVLCEQSSWKLTVERYLFSMDAHFRVQMVKPKLFSHRTSCYCVLILLIRIKMGQASPIPDS